MPLRNLDRLFHPRSVAVLGASNREGTPGYRTMHNLLEGGFEGPILPINDSDQAVAGVFAYRQYADLPLTPDLAVICATLQSIAPQIEVVAASGTKAAILLADERLSEIALRQNSAYQSALEAARRRGLRIMGPNGLGVIVPGIGLNASIAHLSAHPGGTAFISQSAAISSSMLDWAHDHSIGFSYFASVGDMADIDLADLIDYFGTNAMTRAILLYIEAVNHGRRFMSAGRGASRNKPILVIKSGRVTAAQRLAAVRGRAATGADDVYDAAFRRAGMLRVYSLPELFAAVETLARAKPLRGERLAVLTNSCGIGVMAIDSLISSEGELAELDDETTRAIDGCVPAGWPRANPVTLSDDAPPEHYAKAAEALLTCKGVDALLALHAPTALSSSTEAAQAIISTAKTSRVTVLTSWMGSTKVTKARHLFERASIPSYETPTQAVDAFMHMVRFRRNQDMLMQTPPSKPAEFSPAVDVARSLIADSLAAGENVLAAERARRVLAAYAIPTIEREVATTPDDAVAAARKLGFPVTVKALSADLRHAPALGRADFYLNTPDAVRAAALSMLRAANGRGTAATCEGLGIERILVGAGARAVRIGIADDPVFGRVIVFGQGGEAADLAGDRVVALPPLNMNLARELIARSRVHRLLGASGALPAANIGALCLTLVQVSQMIVDLPELVSLDINPLFVDPRGVVAEQVSISVGRAGEDAAAMARPPLAIRPYPKELEEEFILPNGRCVLIRPIRPEDEPAHYDFLSQVTADDIRFRFFGHISILPHAEMARFTQIDYDREMAFIATAEKEDGSGRETLGVVRTITDADNEHAEYAILVRSNLKHQRLGWKLMEKMIQYCRTRGTKRVLGQVLRNNKRMLDLNHALGFKSRMVPDDDIYEVTLDL